MRGEVLPWRAAAPGLWAVTMAVVVAGSMLGTSIQLPSTEMRHSPEPPAPSVPAKTPSSHQFAPPPVRSGSGTRCASPVCGASTTATHLAPRLERPQAGPPLLGSSSTNWLVANWSGEGMIAENPNNPKNLVAGGLYQYGGSYNSSAYYTTGVSGAFTSWDGGRTWVDQTLPISPDWTSSSSPTCGHEHLADTAIGFGGNNTVYYVDLTTGIGNQTGCTGPLSQIALYVTISIDGGNTWGTPIGLAGTVAGGFMDKPWIAVDAKTGEVYVAYNDDNNGTIALRNSTDHGRTWSPPVNVSTAGGLGVEIVVDPSGGVDAVWYGAGGIEFSRSTDHAAHFSAPTMIGTAVSGASPTPDFFRAFTLPGLGVDGFSGNSYTGRLFAIWQNGSGGVAGSPFVSVAYSSNNGTTWTPPATVNSNLTQEAYQPDIAVGPDGTVYAEWYGERPSDGHYRLYAAESRNGGATFENQFSVSNNDSVPTYRTGGQAGWWIGDYTHIMTDQLGARPLWTDARSPLSWSCSPCLWGVDYNITFYTAELTNVSIGANVPVNISVNGTVPFRGNLSAGGPPAGVSALVGDSLHLTVPPTVYVNGVPWYFDVWFGSVATTNRTLATTVHGADRLTACYVPTLGERCHAAGAPGALSVNIRPVTATVEIDHAPAVNSSGVSGQPELPGSYVVQAWAVGYWPVTVVANVTPGNVTYVNVTLSAVPGTLAGSVGPVGASVRLNGTALAVARNGSFSATVAPGDYTLTATLRNYAPYVNSSVSVRFNHTTFLPITLAPVPGWINGTVAPGNATVTVNGIAATVTAGAYSVREGLGMYWVNATSPGFYSSSSGPLRMDPFGRLTANVSLVLIIGTLVGTVVPSSATILVDGLAVNLTGGVFSLDLPPGSHTVDASASQFNALTTTAVVRANAVTTVKLSLPTAPGWIAATIVPSSAAVTLDGKPVVLGTAGTFNLSVAAGAHLLVATLAGFGEIDRTVVVHPGTTAHATITLNQVSSSAFGDSTTLVGLLVAVGVAGAAVVGYVVLHRRRTRV
ncbi:MAG: glycoside hydrolase [Thermoplasmata archaeon]|nr:glycoside hydrolase [Thermoplasmata archaeon]